MRLQKFQEGQSTRKKKRVGRGNGSGRGAKSGRGQKGQKSRTGYSRRYGFEGGQTPFIQRIPQLKGFKNPNRVEFQVVNLADLEEKFKDGDAVNVDSLAEKRLIRKKKMPVKILARGKLSKKLKIEISAVSEAAKKAVEKAGGSIA